MTIGQVAKKTGFTASAIRFYEQSGILPKPVRISGKRHYSWAIFERLAVVERAKSCGFSLTETRQLFYGFRENAPASERWRIMASQKIAELDELAHKIETMKQSLQIHCRCADLAECGRQIWAKQGATETPHANQAAARSQCARQRSGSVCPDRLEPR